MRSHLRRTQTPLLPSAGGECLFKIIRSTRMILDRKGLSAVTHRSERRNYLGLEPFGEKCTQSGQLMAKLQQRFGVGSNLLGPSRHHLQVCITGTQSFFVRTKNLTIVTEQLVADKIEKPSPAVTGTS